MPAPIASITAPTIETFTIGSSPAKGKPPANQTEKIKQAAQQFEALLTAQILRIAREATASDDGDQTKDIVMGVAENQIGLALAQHGGLGLADQISRQLSASPASAKPTPDASQAAK